MGRNDLLGRDREQRRMRELLGQARNGRGGSLVITGEPGIGTTSILDATTRDAPGMNLLRVDGYEAESTIPFAAPRLTVPLTHLLDQLSAPRRQALLVANGSDTDRDRLHAGPLAFIDS